MARYRYVLIEQPRHDGPHEVPVWVYAAGLALIVAVCLATAGSRIAQGRTCASRARATGYAYMWSLGSGCRWEDPDGKWHRGVPPVNKTSAVWVETAAECRVSTDVDTATTRNTGGSTGGGNGVPAANPTAAAIPPARGAPVETLPVTGAALWVYPAAALVLVAGGVGLTFVPRRRRTLVKT